MKFLMAYFRVQIIWVLLSKVVINSSSFLETLAITVKVTVSTNRYISAVESNLVLLYCITLIATF